MPFAADPLGYLEQAHWRFGDLVAFTEGRSMLRGSVDCSGCIGAFGAEHNRVVLTRAEDFTVPRPLADGLDLPPQTRNLAAGLFSMSGPAHRQRRKALAPLFSASEIERYAGPLAATCDGFLDQWELADPVDLLEEMRCLSFALLDRVLCGSSAGAQDAIGPLVRDMLRLRRLLSQASIPDERLALRETIIATGQRLDRSLRSRSPGTVTTLTALASACLPAWLLSDETGDSFSRRTNWSLMPAPSFALERSRLRSA